MKLENTNFYPLWMNGIDLHNDTDYERGCDGTECDGRFEFVLTGELITFAALQQWGVESFRANSDASRCFTLGYDPVELRGIECDSTRRPLCQWHCGEKISPARLEARPVAQYCIDCKTELEENERRYSDSEGDDESSELERFDDVS